jgi:hypothetical protein
MTEPEATPTYQTLDHLAAALGLSRRGVTDIFETYREHRPVRVRTGVRRQLLIHPEDMAQVVQLYSRARDLEISLVTLLRLLRMPPLELQARLPPRSSGVGDGLGSEVQHLRSEVERLTGVLEEVARNQAYLLRVVAPLARERGEEGLPVPSSSGRASGLRAGPGAGPLPNPAPARVVARPEADVDG